MIQCREKKSFKSKLNASHFPFLHSFTLRIRFDIVVIHSFFDGLSLGLIHYQSSQKRLWKRLKTTLNRLKSKASYIMKVVQFANHSCLFFFLCSFSLFIYHLFLFSVITGFINLYTSINDHLAKKAKE